MIDAANIQRKAAELGKLTVRMTAVAGSGHPTSSLSLAHLVTILMYRQMHWDPADPLNPGADRLVLSEGHAVPIIYAAYADLGGKVAAAPGRHDYTHTLTKAELDTLRSLDSVLDGHPNPAEGVPFFDAATGSLGMGLSVAAGLGLAARRDQSPRRIYAIVGDGESREGQIWEALDFIVDQKLMNVCTIMNCNGLGQANPVSTQQSAQKVAAKLAAFGFQVASIDGHDPDEIFAAFEEYKTAAKPFAIVARTIKGWGFDALQLGNWHGKPADPKDLDALFNSIDVKIAAMTGAVDHSQVPPPEPPAAFQIKRPDPDSARWPDFADAMAAGGQAEMLAKGKLATRRAYGAALKVAGDVLPQIAVLDGDVSNSTFTEIFGKAHPDRFFECKIAEQNMISTAVGLAAAGYIPFANSFAKFLARGYDQVELAVISRANIKLVGSHAGITPSSDGPSQMSLPDVAYFRSFTSVRGDDRESPLLRVFQPADAVAAYACTRMLVNLPHLGYMRTHRPDVPLLYAPQTKFEPGGFHVLQPGDDLAVVSSGYMVHVAREAVSLLAKQGIRAALIDTYTLPIHADALADVLARCGGRTLTVEDNYGGGFGSAVAEIAAQTGRFKVQMLFCQRIPKSARTPEDELGWCGLSATQIADHALALLKRP